MDHGSVHPEGALQDELATIQGKLDRILGALDERRARRIPITRPIAGASVALSTSPGPRPLTAQVFPVEPPAAVRCPRCEGDLVECRASSAGSASRIEYTCLCMDCGNHFKLSRLMFSSET